MDQPRTLAIDIGGSGIKAAVLDEEGNMIGLRQRVPTPPRPVLPEHCSAPSTRRQRRSALSTGCRSAFPAMCATVGC